MTDKLRQAGSRAKDMTGMRFGRLLVVERHALGSSGQAVWLCVCDCGISRAVLGGSLRSGKTTSCGCYFRQVASKTNVKHGLGRSKTAGIWRSMISRCTNAADKSFGRYGGRGIKVCDKWQDFLKFLEDMGECPEGHSIERLDNDRGYEPDNCKWIPSKLQVRNRRNTLRFNGKPLIEIAEETGIRYATLYSRLKKHGSPFVEANHV